MEHQGQERRPEYWQAGSETAHAKNGTARSSDLEEKDRAKIDRDVMQENEGRAQSKEFT